MVPGRIARGPWVFRAGRYASVFYPFRRATTRSDWTMRALRIDRLQGRPRRPGIRGRTRHLHRDARLVPSAAATSPAQVRNLYNQGCYVRVLYSFMGYGEYRMLKAHSGPRMRVRRVLFAGPLGRATKYSHMKMVAVSGVSRATDRAGSCGPGRTTGA